MHWAYNQVKQELVLFEIATGKLLRFPRAFLEIAGWNNCSHAALSTLPRSFK